MIFNNHRNKYSILAKAIYCYQFIKNGKRVLEGMGQEEMQPLLDDSGLEVVQVYSWGVLPINREDTKVPLWLYLPVNRVCSHLSVMRRYSQNLIYVCRRKVIP